MSFDPALPKPYSTSWQESFRLAGKEEPRLTSYQSPKGTLAYFIWDTTQLTGGQSVDTGEYPFFGLWSNTAINELTPQITVTGYLRGPSYITARNQLVESLRVKTNDDTPGYIDLPLWGRFPVVVSTYSVDERAGEKGHCAVSITFKRAGIPAEERWSLLSTGDDVYGKTASSALYLAQEAADNLANLADMADADMLVSGMQSIRERLTGILGRIQAGRSAMNRMNNSINGIATLLAQGVRAPLRLATASYSAAFSLISGLLEIRDSVLDYDSRKDTEDETPAAFRTRNNDRQVLLEFLSGDTYTVKAEAVTVKQIMTKEATENFIRIISYCASAQLIIAITSASYQQIANYWSLFSRLESSIDQSDVSIYKAVQDVRIAASRELAARQKTGEIIRQLRLPRPLLHLSLVLGCPEAKLRELNAIADSFRIQGNVIYV